MEKSNSYCPFVLMRVKNENTEMQEIQLKAAQTLKEIESTIFSKMYEANKMELQLKSIEQKDSPSLIEDSLSRLADIQHTNAEIEVLYALRKRWFGKEDRLKFSEL
jgi:uncharacterized Zn finger protein (UPF0148 family)